MTELPTRLLRETLRAGLTRDSSSGCLDTETLAAWSDGTLSGRDRAAAEAHAASCARCQALLAAMVKSTPDVPSRTWWRPSVFGWLAPLAAAAAALIVWINIPHTPPRQPVAAGATAASAPATAPSIAEQSRQPTSRPTDATQTADAGTDALKKGLEPKVRAAAPAPATPHREKAERLTAAAAESMRSGAREAEPGAPSGALRDSAVATPPVVPPLPVAQPAPPPAAAADAASTANTAPAS